MLFDTRQRTELPGMLLKEPSTLPRKGNGRPFGPLSAQIAHSAVSAAQEGFDGKVIQENIGFHVRPGLSDWVLLSC